MSKRFPDPHRCRLCGEIAGDLDRIAIHLVAEHGGELIESIALAEEKETEG